MPRFRPFAGLRYDPARVHLDEVAAPPYDVIDDLRRARLAGSHPYNAVRIDLPIEDDDRDRYVEARRLFTEWQDEGVLRRDPTPAFYAYRMDYTDLVGRPTHTIGVIGALELSRPDQGEILPHEQTTPKAKSDRLEMLRACRANLSAIWALSPAVGLTDLCAIGAEPDAAWTASDGVRHALWAVTDPARVAAIEAAVTAEPVLIADGHHRFETSLAYRDERRAADGDRGGPYDAAMTFVVELVEHELLVLPIHRLVSGLPAGFDLVGALAPFFELTPAEPVTEATVARMQEIDALTLVLPDAAWYLSPRPEAMAAARDLDSSRLDVALAALPPHTVSFQHGVAHVLDRLRDGEVQAGVLLRPVRVAQIAEIAHGGERMPPKSTYFHPKPSTGAVFRTLD